MSGPGDGAAKSGCWQLRQAHEKACGALGGDWRHAVHPTHGCRGALLTPMDSWATTGAATNIGIATRLVEGRELLPARSLLWNLASAQHNYASVLSASERPASLGSGAGAGLRATSNEHLRQVCIQTGRVRETIASILMVCNPFNKAV